ncbi:hypothetical protein PENSPDRAFT_685422 [Peniophora sp. CONT]|nr:hypothetical protein PENSPDRAFT_685422 [Peniophora sp. CONT]
MSAAIDAGTVNSLLAPDLVGILISYFLYGALFLQMFTYMTHFRRDRWIVTITVYGVFLAETLLLIVTTRVVYALLCEGWGDREALNRLTWVDAFIPILSGVISGGVQIFYAFRIYILGRKTMTWASAALITLPFMLASTIGALYAGFATIVDTSLAAIQSVRPAIIVWLVCSMVCDILIAVSMTVVLGKSRKMLRWSNDKYTEIRLTRVIHLSVEAGFLTMAGTVIMLVFFFAVPKSRLFTIMGFINSKLYSNSLMAQLNYRVTDSSREPSRQSHSAGSGSGIRFHSGGADRRISAAVFSPSRQPPKPTREPITIKHMTVEGFDDAGNAVPLPQLNISLDRKSMDGFTKEALAREESMEAARHAEAI